MRVSHHFTSVRFINFKAFKNYSIALSQFNVLVGPNNSGKSTIIGAFRILSEGIRKASLKKPERLPGANVLGYPIPLEGLPVATENVFADYDDSEPAIIDFRLSSGNSLRLNFPETNVCYMTTRSNGPTVRTPTDFKKTFNVSIGFVPVLGPVEHDEPLFLKEAARRALLTHRASRNFRNIWHHYPDNFDEFQELIRTTWPGMDIQKPEVIMKDNHPTLYMFCPEERIPRELYWAGFGFQVWCQMLTFMVKSRGTTIFIIDEPDIYLHSDLQRQLLSILKTLGPDILIATHSTEMISEADPDDLLVINKTFKSAKRIKDPRQIQEIFHVLGSNLNPTLTQLAKAKRVLFVEGKDFQLIAQFARKLYKNQIANRSDFAVVPAEGFNPQKVREFTKGIEATLGVPISSGVLFDRDYRSVDETKDILAELKDFTTFSHILDRKEIENYLLEQTPLRRAIEHRLEEKRIRTGKSIQFVEDMDSLLDKVTTPFKHRVAAQYMTRREQYEKAKKPNLDPTTIRQKIMMEFDELWGKLSDRVRIVPGKEVFASLNQYLQQQYQITISPNLVIESFHVHDIPSEIVLIIDHLDQLRKQNTSNDM